MNRFIRETLAQSKARIFNYPRVQNPGQGGMPVQILTVGETNANLKNKDARWPDGRRTSGRLGLYARCSMQPTFSFTREDSIFTIGSCFARNIEKRLASHGFKVPMLEIEIPAAERVSSDANEIINKYTPHAVLNELKWAFNVESPFPDIAYLEAGDGLWIDPHLHPNIPPVGLARAKERRAMIQERVRTLASCRVVVFTLGLSEAWFDHKCGLYLNGMPPRRALQNEPQRFTFRVLSYSDVYDALVQIHSLIREYGHPDFKMLLTVSPVPFKATFTGKDAIMANTYSKAVLRAAAEEYVTRHVDVDYFPSYEIVTLSDRSVAYMPDNIHVQPALVDQIMDQVLGIYAPDTAPIRPVENRDNYGDTTAAGLYAAVQKEFRAKNYLQAAKLLQKILETYGPSTIVSEAEFRLQFGVALLRAGDTRLGEIELRKVVEAMPDNARANQKLGTALSRLKRRNEALIYLKRAAELDPNNAQMLWAVGRELHKMRRPDEAREYYIRSLAVDPCHVDAKRGLASLQK